MRRLLTITLCSLGWLVIPSMALAERSPADPAESADQCVGFTKTENSDGLVFEMRNECGRELSCKMSWNLKCGDEPPQLEERGQEKFQVSTDASHSVAATMTACGNRSWRIDGVQWSCSGK